MAGRLISIRFGANTSPHAVSLDELRLIGEQLLAAVRAQSQDPALRTVRLMELLHGSKWTVWGAPTRLGGEAVAEIVADIAQPERSKRSNLDREAAGALTELFARLHTFEDTWPLKVRAERPGGIRQTNRGWAYVTQEVEQRLAARRDEPADADGVQGLVVVGDLYEINRQTKTLKVRVSTVGHRLFEWKQRQWPQIEKASWGKVRAKGVKSPGSLGRYQLVSLTRETADAEQLVTLDESIEKKRAFLEPLSRVAKDPALRKKGWDSYDAVPLDDEALARAERTLLALRAQLALEGLTLPPPFVSPTPRGSVQAEWEAGERYFELEFTSDGKPLGLIEDPAGSFEGALDDDDLVLLSRRFLEGGKIRGR